MKVLVFTLPAFTVPSIVAVIIALPDFNYVKNKYMNYHTEGMFKKGIYIKSNVGELIALVLCWVGFVIFSICYLIAIFCGIDETQNGEYECTSRCPLNGFCNYMHYKGDSDNSKSSNSLWNNFWGLGNSPDTNTK